MIVCDHPLTTARINPDRRDVIQIVHVHGTYWYYDCCNLKYEITAQARETDRELSSMPMLLTQVLSHRSPLVVGYSGWEDDLIMGTLKRKLSERLPYNIYWFCYSDSDFSQLPSWLHEHQNVRFIRASRPDAEADRLPRIREDDNTLTGGEAPLLPAQRVFDTLIQLFEVEEPPLTADPLGFLSARLRLEAGIATTAIGVTQDSPDLYDFASVIERIERAARLEKLDTTGMEPLIESARSLLRRSDYAGIAKLAKSGAIQITELTDTQLDAYTSALESAARNLIYDDAEDTSAVWNLALLGSEQILARQGSDAARLRLAQNQCDFADILFALADRPSEASTITNFELFRAAVKSALER